MAPIVPIGRSPMFIRFANGDIGPETIVKSFQSSCPFEESKAIAKVLMDSGTMPDVEPFRSDFRNLLKDFLENGPTPPVKAYLNAYTEPSLEEHSTHEGKGSWGTTSYQVAILDKDAPWIEALICYNFLTYLKGFGREDLKCCPRCDRFFAHKGKYAKYCSDPCKINSGDRS